MNVKPGVSARIADLTAWAGGLEFRRVLICPADQQQYPATPYGARLLYVALSRATHALTIVTDTASPISHLDCIGIQPKQGRV